MTVITGCVTMTNRIRSVTHPDYFHTYSLSGELNILIRNEHQLNLLIWIPGTNLIKRRPVAIMCVCLKATVTPLAP